MNQLHVNNPLPPLPNSIFSQVKLLAAGGGGVRLTGVMPAREFSENIT